MGSNRTVIYLVISDYSSLLLDYRQIATCAWRIVSGASCTRRHRGRRRLRRRGAYHRGMTKPLLTQATRGPLRRTITVVSLLAAGLALVSTVAMVIVALGGYSSDVLRAWFIAWLASLIITFVGARLLRVDDSDS